MTHLTRPVKRTTRTLDKLPHGVRDSFVVTLYPGGLVGIREHRRLYEVRIGVGKLYADLVAREAAALKRERKAARRARRTA